MCTEYDFSQVAHVDAYVLGKVQFPTPVFLLSSTASPDVVDNINGLYRVSFMGDLKAADKSTRTVAGVVHQVNVSWEFVPTTEEQYEQLATFQSTPHELLITYLGGVKKVIRTDADGYSFDFYDDNGRMKCNMTLTNGQGLTHLM